MSFIRISKSKENPYTMINNEILDNEKLSWKAKGILAYLLRLPNDWQIYEEEISSHAKDGLTSFKSGIKELIDNGYIVRTQLRNEKGQFIGYDYCISEFPTESRKSNNGESDNGKPVVGETGATNTNNTNTDINQKLNKKEKTIYITYEKAKGTKITKAEKNKLDTLIKNFDPDLIIRIIDYMVEHGKVSLYYLKVTLNDLANRGITTIEIYEKTLEEWYRTNEKANKNKRQKVMNLAKGMNPKRDAFTDYDQRTYDFKELERKLLGWEKVE